MLPKGDEYVAALQHPTIVFRDADLKLASFETARNGLPKPYSGGFTMTFHAVTTTREWAVRCFTREVSELSTRYQAISEFLATRPDPMFVQADLKHNELLVGGKFHAIIKMDWVRGRQINAYIEENLGKPEVLRSLADNILQLGTRLESLGVAHGDLQHGNIIVDAADNLLLVDYDDIFLPSLAHLSASSALGHKNYQHPMRASSDFGPKLDRFSVFVLYVAITALADDPTLWARFNGGDENILFTRSDFENPDLSPLLDAIASRKSLSILIDRFVSVCRRPFADIPAIDDFISGRFAYSPYVSACFRGTTPAQSSENVGLTAAWQKAQASHLKNPASVANQGMTGSQNPTIGSGLFRKNNLSKSAIIVLAATCGFLIFDRISTHQSGDGAERIVDALNSPESIVSPNYNSQNGPVDQHPAVANSSEASMYPSVAKLVLTKSLPTVRSTAPSPRVFSSPAPGSQAEVKQDSIGNHPSQDTAISTTVQPTKPHSANPKLVVAEKSSSDNLAALASEDESSVTNSSPRTHMITTPLPRVTDAAASLLAAADESPPPDKTSCPNANVPAHITATVKPVFPDAIPALKPGAAVVVKVSLDSQSKVIGTEVDSSSGDAQVDSLVVNAAKQSKYSTAITNCVAAPSSFRYVLTF
jgi:hypothetical protein